MKAVVFWIIILQLISIRLEKCSTWISTDLKEVILATLVELILEKLFCYVLRVIKHLVEKCRKFRHQNTSKKHDTHRKNNKLKKNSGHQKKNGRKKKNEHNRKLSR